MSKLMEHFKALLSEVRKMIEEAKSSGKKIVEISYAQVILITKCTESTSYTLLKMLELSLENEPNIEKIERKKGRLILHLE